MKHITIFTDAYTGKKTYGIPDVNETCCEGCKNYETECKKHWGTAETYPEYPSECDNYIDCEEEYEEV